MRTQAIAELDKFGKEKSLNQSTNNMQILKNEIYEVERFSPMIEQINQSIITNVESLQNRQKIIDDKIEKTRSLMILK